jgi:hypothetical protein
MISAFSTGFALGVGVGLGIGVGLAILVAGAVIAGRRLYRSFLLGPAS